jgi:Fe2+ transport system protein FeoA
MLKNIKRKIQTMARARRIKNLCLKKHACEDCRIEYKQGMSKLSLAKKGVYEFICAKCDECLAHRLLEMGFIPSEDIEVLSNTGSTGSVMIAIKGSKIALSSKIADNILVMEKN